MTDIIVIIALTYHFCIGWQKGLLETLIGPISVLAAGIYAYIYYTQTHNLLISLLIGSLGPLVFQFTYFIFKTLTKKKDAKESFKLSLPRFFAGIIHALWSLVILGLALILIVLIPASNPYLVKAQNNILNSKSYQLLQTLSNNRLAKKSIDINQMKSSMKDPKLVEKFQSTKEYQDLVKDPRIKEILSDEAIQNQIKNNEFIDLLKNPKIQEMIKDEKLFKQLLKLNQKLSETTASP